MSLFHVKRFMGEDEETGEDKNLKAENILKKLKAEAEAKKAKKIKLFPKDAVDNDGELLNTDGIVKHVSVENEEFSTKQNKASSEFQRHKHDKGALNEKQIQAKTDDIKAHKSKKKKHRHSESPPADVDQDKTEKQSHKRKRKKHKQSKEENLQDTLDFSDSHDDENITEKQTVFDKLTKSGKKRKQRIDGKSKSLESNEAIDENGSNANYFTPKKKKKVGFADEAINSDENDVTSEEMNDVPDEELDETAQERPGEIGGFTVIGSYRKSKLEKVKRVLPDWLANPSVISADLKKNQMSVEDMPGLDKDIVERLLKNNISHFFPVQMQVIPALLDSISTGFHIGRAGYRPSDICVSAPTGSGKTLAFVLPIVQALRNRVTREVRALVVLPVRDLATQVFKVFQTYAEGSNLKVGLLVGQKIFSVEQQSLVKKRLRGYQCMYDIIVATPGRLVDHINKTEGFDLTHLRFLVIDEADRVMGEIKQDWLIQVETAVYKKTSHRSLPGPLTAASCGNMEMPLQKLLYSATLSSNPEKLQQLNLFQPKLFTSVVMATENRKQPSQNANDISETDGGDSSKIEEKSDSMIRGEFVGKYTTPAGLSEFYIEATAEEKPLMVLYLLHHLKFRNVLCFTNSLEATHRLFWIIKLVGGIEVKEFSSKRHSMQRDKILQKFQAGKIDIVICSDAMARGMDIENVKYVISYDPPPYIKTYVHRIGRTARAGKVGSAITFLQKKEFYHFKKMVRESGKSNIKAMRIMKKSLKPLIPNFKQALQELPEILKREKQS